jgi:CHAT domain-containing protein
MSIPAVLCVLALSLATPVKAAATFTGFNDTFNLGQSASSGAVCRATRSFDDPLVGHGRRAWDISCRGWSQKLGTLYVFDHAPTPDAVTPWRAALAAKADCQAAGAAQKGLRTQTCKTKTGGFDYVVVSGAGKHGAVAAEGMAAIADVLTTGARFAAGSIKEPAAIDEQTASVSQVTSAQISSLAAATDATAASPDALRRQAYERSEQWRFDDAEAVFAEIATKPGAASNDDDHIEALYNFALNVSNKLRFAEADVYFQQADAALAAEGGSSELTSLGLNYKAVHARNQGHYEDAVRLADAAIAVRAKNDHAPASMIDKNGVASIIEVSSDLNVGLTPEQKDALRDVQALEVKATSQELLDRPDDARATLMRAIAILDRPISVDGNSANGAKLGDGSPWLNTSVRSDLLRLDRDVGHAGDSIPQFRIAVTTFGLKHPDSLPLAGLLVELARAESAAGQEDRAITDYEAAFDIFRRERGSLDASADLVGNYFDILLRRIERSDTGAAHEKDQFFTASQTLIAQSSAEAAKRQAARLMAGSTVAAGLARALDDTNREILAKGVEIRRLQQQNAYQGEARATVDAALKSLTEQSGELEQRLLQADPSYATSLRSVVTLAELQHALKPGEVYIKAFLLANRGYGILVTSTSAKPYAIELNRAGAQKLVDTLRRPIDRAPRTPGGNRLLGRYDVALARHLFVTLFGPVQGDLLAAKNIIYEPDSTLIGAPIAALVVDDASVDVMAGNIARARAGNAPLSYQGVAWLGEKISSSIALSPIAFVQARAAGPSKADRAFIGFGNPLITDDPRAFSHVRAPSFIKTAADYCQPVRQALMALPQLPDTATEVQTIAASFGEGSSRFVLGPSFTDADVMARGQDAGDLTHYKIVYFATHGILPPSTGCVDPALVTSLGDGDSDALLDVNKIQNLHLDADLVVLSACDTGRSSGGNSDAVGGLVQTFVQAGARNLLVSNWSVDTVATEQLMTAMFKGANKSQSEALADAERMLIHTPRYSHPFYWASFMVVGDGARALPSF